MPEPGETPQSDIQAVPPDSAETEITKNVANSVLDRETPLTIDEISNLQSEEIRSTTIVGGIKYKIDDTSVVVYFNPIIYEELSEEKQQQITTFLRGPKEDGEKYRYERFVVNALIEQLRIAKKFELPSEGLFSNIKVVLTDENTNTMIADGFGYLYLRAVAKNIDNLRKQGATDEQIITELAGHIFHEAVHNADEPEMKGALLNGRSPIGEITSITTQLAYYLEKRFNGPRAYDNRWYKNGLKKIQNSDGKYYDNRDYGIATCIANTLLRRALQDAYPTFPQEAEDLDPYATCGNIIANLSPEERQKLIPILKKAVEQSANENEIQAVFEQLRQRGTDR